MRLLISDKENVFEAPTVWLTEDFVPVVGKQHLFSTTSKYDAVQEGPYNWIKIAVLDTVQIDLEEGSMVWLPTIYEKQGYERFWNSIHAFVDCGLLHDRQHVNNCDSTASATEKAVEQLEESDKNSTIAISEGLKLNGIKNFFCFSINDFEELLEKAANTVDCFKKNSLKDDTLYDAIFGLLYAYILPFIKLLPSDNLVISQIINHLNLLLLRPIHYDQSNEEMDESRENRKQMLLQMKKCSYEVLNNQKTNYFFFVASNESSNDRFSFNISLSSRSLREIVLTTISRNVTIFEQIETLSKNLSVVVQSNYDANQNQIIDLLDENSSLFENCNDTSWWPNDIERLVMAIHAEVFGAQEHLDVASLRYRKMFLICLDISLKAAFKQILLLYCEKYASMIALLSEHCQMPNISDRVDDMSTKLRRYFNVREVSVALIQQHVAEIYDNLDEAITAESALEKGRFLVKVIGNIENMLKLVLTGSYGADGLMDSLFIILPMFDSRLFVHLKLLSDFHQFAMPGDSGILSYVITSFLMAYRCLLVPSVDSKIDDGNDDNRDELYSSNDSESSEVHKSSNNVQFCLENNCVKTEYDHLREKMADAWKEFMNQYNKWVEVRKNCIISLKEVAEMVHKTSFDTNVTNIVASSVGIASGIVGIIGLALIPFTAGISSVLVIGSAVSGGASALTSGGAFIAKLAIQSQQGKRVKKCCDENKEASDKLFEALNRFNELKEKYFQSQPDFDQKQRSVSRGVIEVVQQVSEISRMIAAGISPFKAVSLVRVGSVVAEGAEAVASTLGNALKVVRLASIAVSSAFIVLDVWSLVMSAIDTHNGSKTEFYNDVINIVNRLETESQYYSTALKFCEDIRIN